jgi:Ca2+-binding EF-hand superfamily protein
MNPFRKQLIKKAFNKLDANGNGAIEVDDIKKTYNAENHPDVRSKKKTEMQVLSEFLETFEAHRKMTKGDTKSKKGDGVVTLNEFMDYYSNVSASIDNDDYFQLMITNAWNLEDKTFKSAIKLEY